MSDQNELIAAVKQNSNTVSSLVTVTSDKSILNEALYEAMKFVHPSLENIKLLIKAGADVNGKVEKFNNQSPFHACCYFSQDVNVLKYLYSVKASPMITDEEGLTPFHSLFLRLSYSGSSNTPSSNDTEVPAEYFAKYYERQENIIKYFVNRAADSLNINVRDYQGKTVLHYLVNSQSIVTNDNKFAPVWYIRPLVNFLVERGALLNARDNLGCTPILSLIQATPGRNTFENKNAVLVFKSLLMSGADITLPDYHGNTPLLTALKLKSLRVAQILLHQIRNSYNNDYASARNTSRALLNTKYMSDTNNDSVGSILHHLLYEYGNDCSVEAIKLLIDAGINVSQDSELGTPLFMAAWGGNLQFIKTLIEYTHESEHNRGAASTSADAIAGTGNEKQVTVGTNSPSTTQKKLDRSSSSNIKPKPKSTSKFGFGKKKKQEDTISDTSSNTASVMEEQQVEDDVDPDQYHIDVNAYSTVNDSIKAYFGGIEDCLAPVEKATPLHAAIAMGRTKIVQYLLSVGADVKAEAMISSQYRSSAQRSSFTIVEILRDSLARGIVSESDGVIILDALTERAPQYMRTILDQYPIKDRRRSLLENGSRNHEKKMADVNGRLF